MVRRLGFFASSTDHARGQVEFEPPIRRVENFPIDTVPRGQTGSCAVSLHVARVTLRHEMQDTAHTTRFSKT
jgi:hypothetical protein